MNRTRRATLALVTLAALGGARAAFAQQPGVNYSLLKPEQPVGSHGKIEVLEFFWYGCIHCYNLQPVLEPWLRSLPPDVLLRRVPAIFNPRWAHDATLYYTLEAMGLIEKLHRPLFDSIHRDRLRTDNGDALRGWLEKQAVDLKRFEETFKSFGVQSKVRQAQQLTNAYRVDGTPTLAVHGRYTVSPEQGGSHRGILAVVDHLIALTRKSGPAR